MVLFRGSPESGTCTPTRHNDSGAEYNSVIPLDLAGKSHFCCNRANNAKKEGCKGSEESHHCAEVRYDDGYANGDANQYDPLHPNGKVPIKNLARFRM